MTTGLPAASAEAVQTKEAATAEGKGEGQAAAAGDKPTDDGPKDEAQQGAPEAYTEFTVPEGYKLEGERLEQTQALFKELGLSQDKAQKLVDKFCELSGTDSSALGQAVMTYQTSSIGFSASPTGRKSGASSSNALNSMPSRSATSLSCSRLRAGPGE